MPIGIYLYDIDKSFGPNIIADYYLTKEKVSTDILKEFIEKHVKKEFADATAKRDNFKYYSSEIKAENIQKNLYLGFILKEDEDLVSLKSIFKGIEEKIVQNYTNEKNKMITVLKEALNSILSLMEKLKEPKLIIETINEKTKKMLDEGKFQEARELIDLGEKIPEKLSSEIKLAEQFFNDKFYKRAKSRYLKAAQLAELIQETEIVSFLRNKAEKIGRFPELLKEREDLLKEIKKIVNELDINQLSLYEDLVEPINRIMSISNTLEQDTLIETLTDLNAKIQKASKLSNEILKLDKNVKETLDKI